MLKLIRAQKWQKSVNIYSPKLRFNATTLGDNRYILFNQVGLNALIH